MNAVENTFIHENVHSKEGFHGVMCATPKMEVFQKAESFKAPFYRRKVRGRMEHGSRRTFLMAQEPPDQGPRQINVVAY